LRVFPQSLLRACRLRDGKWRSFEVRNGTLGSKSESQKEFRFHLKVIKLKHWQDELNCKFSTDASYSSHKCCTKGIRFLTTHAEHTNSYPFPHHLSQNLPFGQIIIVNLKPSSTCYTQSSSKGGKTLEKRRKQKKDCKANCYSMRIALEATRKGKEGEEEEAEEEHKVLLAGSTIRVSACVGRQDERTPIRAGQARRPSGGRARARRGCARGRGGSAERRRGSRARSRGRRPPWPRRRG